MLSRSIAAFALVTTAAAAPLAAQAVVGLKLGPSFGNISNRGVLPGSLDTRTGFAGGIYVGSGGGLLGFGIEALYAQRGASSDQPIATAETRLDYVDVPAYLKVTLPAPGFQPYAFAGPQVSFEVGCKSAYGADCAANSDRKTTDYAGIIGAGIKFGAGSMALGLEGRYVYGLPDLKVSTVTTSESYKTRSFLLLLSLGR